MARKSNIDITRFKKYCRAASRTYTVERDEYTTRQTPDIIVRDSSGGCNYVFRYSGIKWYPEMSMEELTQRGALKVLSMCEVLNTLEEASRHEH